MRRRERHIPITDDQRRRGNYIMVDQGIPCIWYLERKVVSLAAISSVTPWKLEEGPEVPGIHVRHRDMRLVVIVIRFLFAGHQNNRKRAGGGYIEAAVVVGSKDLRSMVVVVVLVAVTVGR